MHITCCACAYQLLCKRTTAVVRPKIQTASTTYPISSNNIFLLFQQHILALQTTYPYSSNNKKRVNHKFMTHPPPNQPGWRVVKSGWRVSKNSSPLETPINTGDSEGKVKSEEYFLYPLLTTFLQAFTLTVAVEQPTGERTASQLFFIRQYTISD